MTPPPHFLVLDLGTSSSKIFIFNLNHTSVFKAGEKHELHRPKEHHVESDALEILASVERLLGKAFQWAEERGIHIESAGMASQRSTFLFWRKSDLQPLTPALSWQDSRAVRVVNQLRSEASVIQNITGIPLSAHFGGPKYRHLVDHLPVLKTEVENGNAWFGPVSTFIVSRLTGVTAVDESIAGRSQLFNLDQRNWDPKLLQLFEVNPDCLPPLQPVVSDWGNLDRPQKPVPLKCVIGDQQAALIGQGGKKTGTLAMNFGTSGSVQLNTGDTPRHTPELLSNVLTSDSAHVSYLLEGTINACNSLFYWLEERLNIPHPEMHWYDRASGMETSGVIVPGFVGMAAPYWKDQFSTVFYKLDSASEDEIVRAGMESIGLLVDDILTAMDVQLPEEPISAGGGGSRPPLLQFIADLIDHPIGHSAMKDRTALGVLRLIDDSYSVTIKSENPDFDSIYFPSKNAQWQKEKKAVWREAIRKI